MDFATLFMTHEVTQRAKAPEHYEQLGRGSCRPALPESRFSQQPGQRAFTFTLNVLAGATLYSQGRRYSKVSEAMPAETAVSRNSCVTGAPTAWPVWAFFFVELFTSLRGEGSPFIAQL